MIETPTSKDWSRYSYFEQIQTDDFHVVDLIAELTPSMGSTFVAIEYYLEAGKPTRPSPIYDKAFFRDSMKGKQEALDFAAKLKG